MEKIKNIFNDFYKSSFDISFYKEIIKEKFFDSLKYLFSLYLIFGIIGGVIFSFEVIKFIPNIPTVIQSINKQAKKIYPKELVITVKDGVLSTNVKEPYFIKFPLNNNIFENLIVIDTKSSAGDIVKYSTVALVNKDSIIYSEEKGKHEYKVVLLNELTGNNVFNRSTYDKILSILSPYLNYLYHLSYLLIFLAIFIWPFLFAFFSTFGTLVYLLIPALLLFISIKIWKKNYSYKDLLKISAHVITIPIIVTFLFGIFNINLPGLVYLAFILIMGLLVVEKISIKKVLKK